jgi:hypothetical protein
LFFILTLNEDENTDKKKTASYGAAFHFRHLDLSGAFYFVCHVFKHRLSGA